MHASSLALMARLLDQVDTWVGGDVLDVGSYDVNGSYRQICENRGLTYYGVDAQPGPNVDEVCRAEDLPPPTNLPWSYGLVISGQMLEHHPNPFAAVAGMKACVDPGGWLIIIAPREQREHRYPLDCWRFLPDGMRALLDGMGEIQTGVGDPGPGGIVDCFGIGRRQ